MPPGESDASAGAIVAVVVHGARRAVGTESAVVTWAWRTSIVRRGVVSNDGKTEASMKAGHDLIEQGTSTVRTCGCGPPGERIEGRWRFIAFSVHVSALS